MLIVSTKCNDGERVRRLQCGGHYIRKQRQRHPVITITASACCLAAWEKLHTATSRLYVFYCSLAI